MLSLFCYLRTISKKKLYNENNNENTMHQMPPRLILPNHKIYTCMVFNVSRIGFTDCTPNIDFFFKKNDNHNWWVCNSFALSKNENDYFRTKFNLFQKKPRFKLGTVQKK